MLIGHHVVNQVHRRTTNFNEGRSSSSLNTRQGDEDSENDTDANHLDDVVVALDTDQDITTVLIYMVEHNLYMCFAL